MTGKSPSWHNLEVDEVLKKLDSQPEGLDESSVKNRLDQYGPNKLDTKRRRTSLERFFQQ